MEAGDNNLKGYGVDRMIGELGNFGKYQCITFTFLSVSVIFNAFITLLYVFTTSNVDQRCFIPSCDSPQSSFNERWIDFAIPHELNSNNNGKMSKCEYYPLISSLPENNSTDWINGIQGEYSKSNLCHEENYDHERIEKCSRYVFRNAEGTIAKEFDLNCPENTWKLAMVGTINNVGQFFGIPLGGYLSDRYGRRLLIAGAGLISTVMGLIKSFSVNYGMFLGFEFFDSLAGSTIYPTAWIIAIEMVGAQNRAIAGSILACSYSIGEVLIGLVSRETENWKNTIRISYLIGLMHVLYFWFLPESIRWLLTKGRIDDALKNLKFASKMNGKSITEGAVKFLQQLKDISLQENSLKGKEEMTKEQLSSLSLGRKSSSKFGTANREDSQNRAILATFKSKTLCWRFLICSFCWITNALLYYGLSLNAVSLSGDKYLNFVYTCLVEIPAYIICVLAMDKLGRRITICTPLLVSGVCCVAAIFCDNNETAVLSLILFLIGKFAITISFTVLYAYTAELFPTKIRQSLLSLCSMFGRTGSLIAPLTPLMALSIPSLPLILFATTAILSGLSMLCCPETKFQTLPDTVEEAEEFGKKLNPV